MARVDVVVGVSPAKGSHGNIATRSADNICAIYLPVFCGASERSHVAK